MITIHIETAYGVIEAQLDDTAAPITVANFLAYVAANAYQGGNVWRTVTTSPDNQPHNDIKIDVIQATCHADFAKFAAILMEGTASERASARRRHDFYGTFCARFRASGFFHLYWRSTEPQPWRVAQPGWHGVCGVWARYCRHGDRTAHPTTTATRATVDAEHHHQRDYGGHTCMSTLDNSAITPV